MARKFRQRTVRLAIVLVLGVVGMTPSGNAPESAAGSPGSACREDPASQQDQAAKPLKGSPELWKFRFIDR